MVPISTDPTNAIPDADLLEQQIPAAPPRLTGVLGDPTPSINLLDADEADLLDQVAALPDDDAEEYPNALTSEAHNA